MILWVINEGTRLTASVDFCHIRLEVNRYIIHPRGNSRDFAHEVLRISVIEACYSSLAIHLCFIIKIEV